VAVIARVIFDCVAEEELLWCRWMETLCFRFRRRRHKLPGEATRAAEWTTEGGSRQV